MALTKPRRTHETSGAMDSRSMTGPFFEVPFNRYHSIREELDRARLSLVERKTVDRAKGLLMEQKGIGEEAAYRLLRKLAMDQNKRVGEVAQDILTYAKAFKL